MPACCKFTATHSAAPQSTPPSIVRRSRAFFSSAVCAAAAARPPAVFFQIERKRSSSAKNSAAIRERTVLKVKAPMESAAALCATNAIPQITAVSKSSSEPRSDFIASPPFSSICLRGKITPANRLLSAARRACGNHAPIVPHRAPPVKHLFSVFRRFFHPVIDFD